MLFFTKSKIHVLQESLFGVYVAVSLKYRIAKYHFMHNYVLVLIPFNSLVLQMKVSKNLVYSIILYTFDQVKSLRIYIVAKVLRVYRQGCI